MTYEEFRKTHPATRCFYKFDSETRAMHASSHRLGPRQRSRVGEYFYTHPLAPLSNTGHEVAYRTAKAATIAAFAVWREQQAMAAVVAEL